jgi:hypothetical protein
MGKFLLESKSPINTLPFVLGIPSISTSKLKFPSMKRRAKQISKTFIILITNLRQSGSCKKGIPNFVL